MAIQLSEVETCVQIAGDDSDGSLCLGRGKANLKLSFSKQQIYYSGLAIFAEKVSELKLCLHDVENILHESIRWQEIISDRT